jgi:hypothetical protein
MVRISGNDYHDLVERSEVIERDRHGEKVIVAPDGHFIKFFRTKRIFSTATIKPYAKRFCDNSQKLGRLSISTVKVRALSYCPENKRYLVKYQPLAGVALRDALRNTQEPDVLLTRFAGFLARLHRQGVYFRSIHFGNLIVQPDSEEFGLIDIADMKIRPYPLGILARARNFRHFFRYREDVSALESFGFGRFLDVYFEQAALSGWRRKAFCCFSDKVIGFGKMDITTPPPLPEKSEKNT